MVQEEAIENFREYLKIPSVHPDPCYDSCVIFLKKKAEEYGLKTQVFHLDEKRPVLIITMEGSEPGLPSILLNSHMDVVPVYKVPDRSAAVWMVQFLPHSAAHCHEPNILWLQIGEESSHNHQAPCVNFLKKKSEEYGLKTEIFHLDEKRPVLIITMEGTEPGLPSILLNSHMDVVPVYKEEWNHDPFGAEMDSEGNIYARGAQDMKCVTIAQLEALRRIKASQVRLKRTVHMTVLPDEEIGGAKGMEKFVHTQTFKDLNIVFDIDEGTPSATEEFNVYPDERCKWGILIHCPGTTGHGSVPHKNTAGEKLRTVIDNLMDRRKREMEKFRGLLYLGDITTINLTTIQGGVQNNVLPSEIVVGFDIRLPPDGDHEEMENWINDVCKKAGKGVYTEYIHKDRKCPANLLATTNPFLIATETTLKSLGSKYHKVNLIGTTDARFVRRVGVPAIGFSPFNHTTILIHAHNEYMNKDIFKKGISIYEKLIQNVANV